MSDLIDRQAAIDAINRICPVDTEYDCTLLGRVDVRYVLSDLPSAQPESADMLSGKVWDEWCTGCKEYDQERHCCPRFNRVIRTAIDDAQPERKKGKWIKVNPHIMICPFCKHASSPKNFCADCGADLREEEQDETD